MNTIKTQTEPKQMWLAAGNLSDGIDHEDVELFGERK